MKIGVFVGSLRKESFNRKIALEIMRLAPPSLDMEIPEIGHLPLYNQDLDEDPPREYVEFRRAVGELDGMLFVTPEYNRSIPAVLKNAIDICSRPTAENKWNGKPAGVVSVSISVLGGFGANHILRQSMVYLNVPVMQQPEAYISRVMDLFDEQGKLNEGTVAFLQKYVEALERWMKRFA